MSYIDKNFIDMLIEKADIVDVISRYVNLKKVGDNYQALCPFHTEKTPSFVVSKSKQIFKCFGCGEGGNVLSFIMKKESISFVEAVNKLSSMYGLEVPNSSKQMTEKQKEILEMRKRLFSLHRAIAIFYREKMLENLNNCQAYLKKRKMTRNIIRKFGIGYSPQGDGARDFLIQEGYTEKELLESGIFKEKNDRIYSRFFNRIMFPIFDDRGRVVGFGGRRLDNAGDYKYINSPDTLIYKKSNLLYGFNLANKYRAKELILVEGYMDVIAFYKEGIVGAIASLGTSLTENQASKMKKMSLPVYIVYDTDKAGKKATNRAIEILKSQNVYPYVISLGKYKDPDEFFEEKTREDFNELKKNAMTAINFQLKYLEKDFDIENSIERNAYLKKASELLSKHINPIETEIEIKRLSQTFYVSEDALKKMVNISVRLEEPPRNYIKPTIDIEVVKTENQDPIKKLFEMFDEYNNAILFSKDILKEEYFQGEDRKRYLDYLSQNGRKNKNLTEEDIETIQKLARTIKIEFLENKNIKLKLKMKDTNIDPKEKIDLANEILEINKRIDSLK